ncbi:MAG: DUF7010 family protein [Anaerolineae bacterium]
MDNTVGKMMTISDAQQDMRKSHVGGSGGILVSGTVWLIAGIVSAMVSTFGGVVTLFLGGMAIYPLGVVFAKGLGGSGQHQKDNPIAGLAIESTALLFIGLFVSFSVYQRQPNWFFPIMLTTIGGRYILFATIYGQRLYWLLGTVLALTGAVMIGVGVPFAFGAFAGGGIEIVFGLIMLWMSKRD